MPAPAREAASCCIARTLSARHDAGQAELERAPRAFLGGCSRARSTPLRWPATNSKDPSLYSVHQLRLLEVGARLRRSVAAWCLAQDGPLPVEGSTPPTNRPQRPVSLPTPEA